METQADARLQTLFPELLPPPRAWTTRTDARGTFSFELPTNSLYRAFATDRARGQVSLVRHDLRADSRIRLLMLKGSRVLIRKRPEGPLAYQILGRHRESQREFTIVHGVLQPEALLPLLPPGPYRIRLRTPRGRSAQAAFVLHPAQDLTLRLPFREPARLMLAGIESEEFKGYRLRLPEALRYDGREEPPLGNSFALPAFDLLLRVQLGKEFWESRELGRVLPGNSYLVAAPKGPGRELSFETGPLAAGAHVLLLWREKTGIARRLLEPGPDHKFPTLGKLPSKDILVLFGDGAGHRSLETAPRGKTGRLRLRPGSGSPIEIQIHGEGPHEDFHPRITLLAGHLDDAPGFTDLYPPSVYYADRRGRILIPGLPAGRWDLLVEAQRHVSQSLSIQTRPGQQVAMRKVEMTLGYRLHGRVLGPGLRPLSGVLVQLSHPLQKKGLAPLETQTDSEGRFLFEGLPEGRFNLEARAEIGGHTWSARRVQTKPGAEARDLVLADEDPVPPGKRR